MQALIMVGNFFTCWPSVEHRIVLSLFSQRFVPQLFYYHEMAARDNEILGQDGVKRAAAEAKRKGASGAYTAKKPAKKLVYFC